MCSLQSHRGRAVHSHRQSPPQGHTLIRASSVPGRTPTDQRSAKIGYARYRGQKQRRYIYILVARGIVQQADHSVNSLPLQKQHSCNLFTASSVSGGTRTDPWLVLFGCSRSHGQSNKMFSRRPEYDLPDLDRTCTYQGIMHTLRILHWRATSLVPKACPAEHRTNGRHQLVIQGTVDRAMICLTYIIHAYIMHTLRIIHGGCNLVRVISVPARTRTEQWSA